MTVQRIIKSNMESLKETKITHSHLNAPVIITYNTTPIFKNVNRLLIVDDSFAPKASAPEIRIYKHLI